MIRFLKVEGLYGGGENDPPQFSFWDTIYSRYVKIGDDVMWDSRDDFVASKEFAIKDGEEETAMANRCERLIQDWVPQKSPLEDD